MNCITWSDDGAFFVTCGNNQVKFWDFDSIVNDPKKSNALESRSAKLGVHKDSNFVGVACGKYSNTKGITYCITSKGILCCVNSKTRSTDRWVNLKVSKANSISVSPSFVICGCSDGSVRLFHPITLEHLKTLPKPHMVAAPTSSTQSLFPDSIALSLTPSNKHLAVLYSDKSVFLWNISDLKNIFKARHFRAHSGCIWDIQPYQVSENNKSTFLPSNSFVTCSADSTIRFWDGWGKELLKTIRITNENVPNTGNNEIRSLAISPDGNYVASGDKQGNLRIHDIRTRNCVNFLEAHDAEILSLDYLNSESFSIIDNCVTISNTNLHPPQLLVSASRDRLIHIFDVSKSEEGSKDYCRLIQTLDDHSSSITSIKFASNGTKLISCSADKSILFRTQIHETSSLQYTRYHQAISHGSVFHMDLLNEETMVSVGQDKKLNIYNIGSGKLMKSLKTESEGGEIKVRLSPSGSVIATSSMDKIIRFYDFHSGECLASAKGHSELITGILFTSGGQRFVSISGDGCIFMWSFSSELASKVTAKVASVAPSSSSVPFHDSPFFDQEMMSSQEGMNCSSPSFEKDQSKLHDDDFNWDSSGLPSWAKKDTNSESACGAVPLSSSFSSPIGKVSSPPTKGRWAQRVEPSLFNSKKEPSFSNEKGKECSSNIRKLSLDTSAIFPLTENKENLAENTFYQSVNGNHDEGTNKQIIAKKVENYQISDTLESKILQNLSHEGLNSPPTKSKEKLVSNSSSNCIGLDPKDITDDSQYSTENLDFAVKLASEELSTNESNDNSIPSTSGTEPNVMEIDDEEFRPFTQADFMQSNFESLHNQPLLITNSSRLSISAKFLKEHNTVPSNNSNSNPLPVQTCGNIPNEPINYNLETKSNPNSISASSSSEIDTFSLAQEVEKTRLRLAQLGIVIPPKDSTKVLPTPTPTSSSNIQNIPVKVPQTSVLSNSNLHSNPCPSPKPRSSSISNPLKITTPLKEIPKTPSKSVGSSPPSFEYLNQSLALLQEQTNLTITLFNQIKSSSLTSTSSAQLNQYSFKLKEIYNQIGSILEKEEVKSVGTSNSASKDSSTSVFQTSSNSLLPSFSAAISSVPLVVDNLSPEMKSLLDSYSSLLVNSFQSKLLQLQNSN